MSLMPKGEKRRNGGGVSVELRHAANCRRISERRSGARLPRCASLYLEGRVNALDMIPPRLRPLTACAMLLGVMTLSAAACSSDAASPETCVDGTRVLNVGFYAFFTPVSYSADEDPNSEGFDTHVGYEADLLTALEAMKGTGLSFSRRGIALWDDIWLQSAGPEYDIVGGGITILDSRQRDAAGKEVVLFTSGHIAFRQSLLVRAEDSERLASYGDLTSDVRVGALAGTTGEFRLLELVGLIGADGVLSPGARVDTPRGTVVADGSRDYVITSANESASLAGRSLMRPPSESMPQVVYLGSETGETDLLEALADGTIDAVARGEIGNRDAVHASGGSFAIGALDDDVEYGGFTLALEDEALASCLDDKISYLTDSLSIGYAEWLQDPLVFMRRAKMWNDREPG